MAAEPGFVHLHVHSSYSLLEGALTIARLAELAKKDRQPALALTDTDNMFGALEFSEKIAGYGIQPIVGCALGIDFGDQENRNPAMDHTWPRIVLLAAGEDGYRSLMRLCSRAYLDTTQNERPHIKLDWLAGEAGGWSAGKIRSPWRVAKFCRACLVTVSTSNYSVTACRPNAWRNRA
jgi:DNA polymerase-3 subunit alpha